MKQIGTRLGAKKVIFVMVSRKLRLQRHQKFPSFHINLKPSTNKSTPHFCGFFSFSLSFLSALSHKNDETIDWQLSSN